MSEVSCDVIEHKSQLSRVSARMILDIINRTSAVDIEDENKTQSACWKWCNLLQVPPYLNTGNDSLCQQFFNEGSSIIGLLVKGLLEQDYTRDVLLKTWELPNVRCDCITGKLTRLPSVWNRSCLYFLLFSSTFSTAMAENLFEREQCISNVISEMEGGGWYPRCTCFRWFQWTRQRQECPFR